VDITNANYPITLAFVFYNQINYTMYNISGLSSLIFVPSLLTNYWYIIGTGSSANNLCTEYLQGAIANTSNSTAAASSSGTPANFSGHFSLAKGNNASNGTNCCYPSAITVGNVVGG